MVNAMLNRNVKILVPAKQTTELVSAAFADVLSYPNIVVLGDPGAGKTTLFEEASKFENGNFFNARNFRIYANAALTGKTVYIDALDEKRSRGDHPDSIADIVEKLVALQPSHVRISCRSLDWLGETDLTLFRPYFDATGGFTVVQLEDLSEDEQRALLLEKNVEDIDGFIEEAEKQGVRALLKNPQTLGMLAKVVQSGNWPETRSQLFDQATKLLISEHNEAKAVLAKTTYRLHELECAAGAACATMLISDEPCISLRSASSGIGVAAFDTVPESDPEIVQAVLGRRAFKSAGDNSVTYSHRTIAEYLGAKWIAENIRRGYPLGRILALIAVEGVPALELRGLYAWLPTFLPSHAIQLIRKEPLAVVMYGDPKSMTPATRTELFTSIEELSRRDPWFRNWDTENEILGSLSGPDMIEKFRTILGPESDNYQLRHLVLEAIACGPALPGIADDLFALLKNEGAAYGDRYRAFEALIHIEPDSKKQIAEWTRNELLTSENQTQLAASIIQRLYVDYFNPSDVATLVETYLLRSKSRMIGELSLMAESVPTEHVEPIVDALSEIIVRNKKGDWRHKNEILALFSRLLARSLSKEIQPKSERIWAWLSAVEDFGGGGNYSSTALEEVRVWLSDRPILINHLFDLAWDNHTTGRWWIFFNTFQKTILHSFKFDFFTNKLLSILRDGARSDGQRCEAYGALLSLAFQNASDSELFEELFTYGQQALFSSEWQDSCQCSLDRWEHEDAIRNLERRQKRETDREKNREHFDAASNLIQTGEHKGWIGWCASVYFANFDDVDVELNPQQRLVAEVGEQRAQIAIAGMRAIANDSSMPTLDEILTMQADQKYFKWWLAALAALDIDWIGQASINEIPDKTLQAALAIQIYCPVFDRRDNQIRACKHGWKEAAYQERTELVLETLTRCAMADLQTGRIHSDAIYNLTSDEVLSPLSGASSLQLLESYPNAPTQVLKHLIAHASRFRQFEEKLDAMLEAALSGRYGLDAEQQEVWLAAAFLQSKDSVPDSITEGISSNRKTELLWAMREAVEFARPATETGGVNALPTWKISYLLEQFGSHFPIEAYPTDGWSGNRNNWDANDFVRKLINEMSTRIDDTSIATLQNLGSSNALKGYSHQLLHALANQAALRRQSEFEQPTWEQAVDALKNGRPANMSDLLETAIFHIRSIEQQMRHSNIDALKVFWNENQYGGLEKPKPEESARDALVMQLRPSLDPIGVRVEPEGHMNQDKRADIVLLPPPGQKLPIELKRDYHDEVWTACANQLDRLYTRDPEASGYGLYVVFWYGDKRNGKISKPPASIKMPASALEMEMALKSLVPIAHRERLRVVVVDVSQVL